MLDLSIRYLEKQKYGATDRPRRVRRPTNLHSRHIPSEVKRTVHDRDGDRCTFVSETGRRCDSRTRLEFDHVVPFALGGRATVDNIRLRCHAHNQYEAELTYGAGFMERKRAEAPG
jgi:5-methylcytosine-specific restriction endonuclease McrA